jgi:hypothetical protein
MPFGWTFTGGVVVGLAITGFADGPFGISATAYDSLSNSARTKSEFDWLRRFSVAACVRLHTGSALISSDRPVGVSRQAVVAPVGIIGRNRQQATALKWFEIGVERRAIHGQYRRNLPDA